QQVVGHVPAGLTRGGLHPADGAGAADVLLAAVLVRGLGDHLAPHVPRLGPAAERLAEPAHPGPGAALHHALADLAHDPVLQRLEELERLLGHRADRVPGRPARTRCVRPRRARPGLRAAAGRAAGLLGHPGALGLAVLPVLAIPVLSHLTLLPRTVPGGGRRGATPPPPCAGRAPRAAPGPAGTPRPRGSAPSRPRRPGPPASAAAPPAGRTGRPRHTGSRRGRPAPARRPARRAGTARCRPAAARTTRGPRRAAAPGPPPSRAATRPPR